MNEKIKETLKKYKYPLIVLLFGIGLLVLPTGGGDDSSDDTVLSDEARLESILEDVQGVGETRVLLSENGVIIACAGAENAEVRLNVIKAASAFTGFSSDKIQVLKLFRSGNQDEKA